MTANLLHAHGLTVCSPGGRRLFRELTLILDRGDRVALAGPAAWSWPVTIEDS